MFNKLKSFYRRGRYGWDYSDCFGMNNYLSTIIPQMIKHLSTKNTYPPQFNSIEEWHDILLEIVNGFEVYNNYENYYISENPKQYLLEYKRVKKELDKSLKLFSKYFIHFWW